MEVNSADWIDVDTLVLWANGEIIETIQIADELGSSGRALDDKVLRTVVKQFDVDTWLVLEAYVSNSLFPVVAPKEDPPSNISGALEGLVGGIDWIPMHLETETVFPLQRHCSERRHTALRTPSFGHRCQRTVRCAL